MHIFVSYSRANIKFAQEVREKIHNFGHGTWMDIYDIPEGALWPDEIDKGLDDADVVIGILSQDAVNSSNVKNEWDWALEYDVPLILLRVADCRIPHRYIRINYIDFTTEYEVGYTRLKTALANPPKASYSLDTGKGVQSTDGSVIIPQAVSDTQELQSEFQPVQLDETARRNRARLLEKVSKFWIEGVLESSLHGVAMIELGLRSEAGAVNHPWNTLLQHDDYADGIQVGGDIGGVFDKMSGELLIMGQPGSGKTTMLLELARKLIEQAETDLSQAIPVMFNLSSWVDGKHSIVEWLIHELNTKYQVSEEIATKWVHEDKLLLLLDGLDEVQEDSRNDCVIAINEFRREHGLSKLVVCSRISDYQALASKLQLQGAIVLKPLADEQIQNYLNQFGSELDALKELIQSQEAFRELLRTPLMLSIILITFRGSDQHELSTISDPDLLRKTVFSKYVNTMLSRSTAGEYGKDKVIHWLSVLASQMASKQKTIFLIEEIQPNLIMSQFARLSYKLVPLIPLTLIYIIIVIIILGYFQVGNLGFFLGILGALINFGLFSAMYRSEQFAKRILDLLGQQTSNITELALSFENAATVAIFGGFLGAGLGWWLADTDNVSQTLINAYATWLIAGMTGFILTLLVAYALSDLQRVMPSEQLKWNFQNAFKLLYKIKFTFIFCVLFGLLAGFESGIRAGIIAWIGSSFVVVVLLGLLGGLASYDIQGKMAPNQGIKQSVRNGFQIGFIMMLLSTTFASIILPLYGLNFEQIIVILLTINGSVWFIPNFMYGGKAAMQHLVIRMSLSSSDRAPFNYSKFLDYCVHNALLRKVGGGYIFIHRSLLEYFSELESDDIIP